MSTEPVDTLDPALLEGFLGELEAAGFAADEARVRWTGPVPPPLQQHTDAETITIILRDGWPYYPPQIDVPGIDSWHADNDHLCLWQPGDDTRGWVTLQGIYDRIEGWATDAAAGFARFGTGLDPHLYFTPRRIEVNVAFDVDELVAGAFQDGQHGYTTIRDERGLLIHVSAGRPRREEEQEGRWLYRTTLPTPPRDWEEFREVLTERQRKRVEQTLRLHGRSLFLLIWTTEDGHAVLPVLARDDGVAEALTPVSIRQEDRLRRAGPDAPLLQPRHVVLFGVGAIGSHVASLLARAGLGHLTLVDGDVITPTVLLRHAAPAETAGASKVQAMEHALRQFDWCTVYPVRQASWAPDALAQHIRGVDLTVDATGATPFAELLARVARREGVPLLTAALFRGGGVIRVRRQAIPADTAIELRAGHWRYPRIPAADEMVTEHLGLEPGCAAPINNAPPLAVVHAATQTARAAVDVLAGRYTLPDEHIEVLEPGPEPFHQRGTLEPSPPVVQLTELASASIHEAATSAYPNETGGILVGVHDETGAPTVTAAVHLPGAAPSPQGYQVPAGATHPAVAAARADDPRVGYLGEWHSHPSRSPASSTDAATMQGLATHPETGNPVLIVAMPSREQYELAAYVTLDGELVRVEVSAVGPLPAEG